MKSFKQFLLEARLSVSDALKIFGLSSSATADEIKKKYRELVVKNHPDTNPNIDRRKIQDINSAYDVLKDYKSTSSGREDFETTRANNINKMKEVGVAVERSIKTSFNPKKFQDHFQSIFNESFEYRDNTRGGYGDSYYEFIAEFHNQSRTTVLELELYVSLSELIGKSTSLGSSETTFSMMTSTSILHNRRKVKLTNKKYNSSTSKAVYLDPNELFPKSKMEVKKDKKTKISKKDFQLSIQKELNGKISQDWFYVPLKHDYRISGFRAVTMRLGSWNILQLEKKKENTKFDLYLTVDKLKSMPWVYETEQSLHWFIDFLKKAQTLNSENEIINYLNTMSASWEKIKNSVHAEIDGKL